MKNKVYVVVRRDLSKSYQAVQGGHALAQLMLEHPVKAKDWNNRTLIYLGVKDLMQLTSLYGKHTKGACFIEPDIGNQMTAFAIFEEDVDPFNFSLINLKLL